VGDLRFPRHGFYTVTSERDGKRAQAEERERSRRAANASGPGGGQRGGRKRRAGHVNAWPSPPATPRPPICPGSASPFCVDVNASASITVPHLSSLNSMSVGMPLTPGLSTRQALWPTLAELNETPALRLAILPGRQLHQARCTLSHARGGLASSATRVLLDARVPVRRLLDPSDPSSSRRSSSSSTNSTTSAGMFLLRPMRTAPPSRVLARRCPDGPRSRSRCALSICASRTPTPRPRHGSAGRASIS
jgi:hypothetical protein